MLERFIKFFKKEMNKLTQQNNTNIEMLNISFNADGTTLRGWLYLPAERTKPLPCIIMAHGFSAIKEMGLAPYARKFSQNGYAVLVYDHKNFGDSDGEPRYEINPWEQIEGYKHAITYASTLPEIDANRIGIWGSSYSGGHVLMVGASDARVKFVVAQVPTISGSETSKRRMTGDALKAKQDEFAQDRINRQQGKAPTYTKVIPEFNNDKGIYNSQDAIDWYGDGHEKYNNAVNKVTLRSVEFSQYYNPGNMIPFISPKPLLMLVAKDDIITPSDLALQAYETALEPKSLSIMPGGHFDPYNVNFDQSSTQALEWYKKYL